MQNTPLDEYNEGKTITIAKVVGDICTELLLFNEDAIIILEHYLNRLWIEANASGYREGY